MPRAAVARARLLDQKVIVKKTHAARAHESTSRGREGRSPDDVAVLGDALPVAKILDERARLARLGRVHGQRTEIGKVPLNARLERGNFRLGKDARQEDDAVTLESLDESGIELDHYRQLVKLNRANA